jgi:hypothetical protein
LSICLENYTGKLYQKSFGSMGFIRSSKNKVEEWIGRGQAREGKCVYALYLISIVKGRMVPGVRFVTWFM